MTWQSKRLRSWLEDLSITQHSVMEPVVALLAVCFISMCILLLVSVCGIVCPYNFVVFSVSLLCWTRRMEEAIWRWRWRTSLQVLSSWTCSYRAGNGRSISGLMYHRSNFFKISYVTCYDIWTGFLFPGYTLTFVLVRRIWWTCIFVWYWSWPCLTYLPHLVCHCVPLCDIFLASKDCIVW